MAFVPQLAPVVVLAFLGTGFLLFVTGAVLLAALLTGRTSAARPAAVAAVVVAGGYGAVLLAASLASSEKRLGAGELKYFCEVDCHLAYSVTGVQKAKTLGAGATQTTAEGVFYVVTLKTWFDPHTTSLNRGNGLLYPNDRLALIVDDQGTRRGPTLPGQQALDIPAAKLVPLLTALRPGDSYETTLVFDVPADAANPRLLLTDPVPINWVLIGHENSFLHKKVYFRLDAAVSRSSGD